LTVVSLIRRAARRFAGGFRRSDIRFEGRFSSWPEAQRASSGYDSEEILRRALDATLKVKRGEAAYERDTVLFPKIDYSFPVLAALLLAANAQDRLSVLDFGGALGSSYFQNRTLLRSAPGFKWGVVEQEKFVRAGREHIEGEELTFHSTIEECVDKLDPNFILLSGVLNYLPDPIKQLARLIALGAPFICIDRTLVAVQGQTRLTVQIVPSAIYRASYPCWVISEAQLLAPLRGGYRAAYEFASVGPSVSFEGLVSAFKGYLFLRNDFAAAIGAG
jgi:putative methyltransferase (TIGR04325 family)